MFALSTLYQYIAICSVVQNITSSKLRYPKRAKLTLLSHFLFMCQLQSVPLMIQDTPCDLYPVRKGKIGHDLTVNILVYSHLNLFIHIYKIWSFSSFPSFYVYKTMLERLGKYNCTLLVCILRIHTMYIIYDLVILYISKTYLKYLRKQTFWCLFPVFLVP